MIRILHLITTMPIGGAESLILTTLQLLDPQRFTSVLCCIQEPGSLGEEAIKKGYRVVSLGCMKDKGFDRQAVRDITEVIRTENIDIVHCHLYHAGLYGRLAAKITGRPVIFTVHNVYSNPKIHRRLINWWLGRSTERIIAVSQSVARDVERYDWIKSPKLLVIPNGIDISPFADLPARAVAKQRLGFPEDALVLGCVGRLEPQKGHRYLLEALSAILVETGDCPHLFIVGDGGERDRLQSLVSQWGLSQRVHLLGARRDIPDLLAAFDVFVLPSLWEGLPLAMLEAMAASLPVIATDVGGIGEVIPNQESGLILPPASSSALKVAIQQLASNSSLRASLGAAAKMRVEQRYSAAAMLGALEDIYVQTAAVVEESR